MMHALEIIKEMVHATQQMNVKKEMVLCQEHVQRVMELAVSVSYFQNTVETRFKKARFKKESL